MSRLRIILGCMTIGPQGAESKGARINSLEEYNACLDFLAKHDYREIDTARVYVDGLQEAFTAKSNYKGNGFCVATKCWPSQAGDHSSQSLRLSLDTSLQELRTEHVDVFYLHAPDRSVPFEQTLKACNDMFKEGKFSTLGLSNYAAWEVAEIVNIARERGLVQPKVYQAMYNVLTREIESELIPCCRKYGIDIVVYNPLAGGILSGKYKTLNIPSSGRFSSVNGAQGMVYRERYLRDSMMQALELIEPVLKTLGITLTEAALRWIVHHSELNFEKNNGNDGIVVGVSSLKQLQENVTMLERGRLPDEAVDVLEAGWRLTRGSCPNYWR